MAKSNCILIVDDSEDTRELFKATLNSERFEVVACADGEEALQTLSQRNDFALMLLDVAMPKMTGIELLTEMQTRGLGSGIPVLLVSAVKDLHLLHVPKSVIGTLQKPFFYPELIFTIKKIVGSDASKGAG